MQCNSHGRIRLRSPSHPLQVDPVSSSTISNWFKNLLLQSGVDTNVFKAQSTRLASTSKPVYFNTGYKKRGCRSKKSTWQKNFTTEIWIKEDELFQEMVLNFKI